jgi:hypothetical protein
MKDGSEFLRPRSVTVYVLYHTLVAVSTFMSSGGQGARTLMAPFDANTFSKRARQPDIRLPSVFSFDDPDYVLRWDNRTERHHLVYPCLRNVIMILVEPVTLDR